MKRLLMLDDEEDLVWTIGRQLARDRKDLAFEGVNDPAEALARVRQAPPDILVTDLRMPKMSGIEVLTAARSVSPRLPVVVVTAYGSPSLRAEVHRSANVAYLEKPFSVQSLLQVVDQLLSRAAAQPAAGFSGAISLPMLPDLVQIYAVALANGQLTIRRDAEEGAIWFERGQIRHAVCASLVGAQAVYALLAWEGGGFDMKEGVAAPAVTIDLPWQELLIEGCRRMDEIHKDDGAEPAVMSSAGVESLGGEAMASVKESLEKLGEVDGFIGACVADSNSGMMLGAHGGGSAINLEVAAAGNTEVVRSKRKAMNSLALKDKIEDILITLGKQYHLIRPLEVKDGLFIYLVLDRQKANLAMGRHALGEVEKTLAV